ncbi:gamma-glutamyl-gamma-aminobutyrate hydrolase family protein [Microlunatus speluncae]|uniref:gamma-glutamyl-gamma-aminobutyrate hydrolase family protein n=1 Tax=Microlunatus speluncae TaxID=2594267 RepID=UPI0012661D2C|nr:gamma-glutamyl-gamma-aminobutyrate hydrolase family protein [Microlunatus speluncae]
MASNASSPLIGISCYLEPARFGVWDTPSALLPRSYLDGVLAAGGTPVLLPPISGWDRGHLSRLDGLIIAGGADVAPELYGAVRDPATGPARPDRDESERTLINTAFEVGLPLLAVCRGMQLLNVVRGGTLHQHLPDHLRSLSQSKGRSAAPVPPFDELRERNKPDASGPPFDELRERNRHLPEPGRFGQVKITVAAGSRLSKIIGEEIEAHCHHHQAVDRLGDDLTAAAWAEDGTVEAIEVDGEQFAVGVQWHPEEDGVDRRLFQELIMEAGR